MKIQSKPQICHRFIIHSVSKLRSSSTEYPLSLWVFIHILIETDTQSLYITYISLIVYIYHFNCLCKFIYTAYTHS